jgi:hypothetical protein
MKMIIDLRNKMELIVAFLENFCGLSNSSPMALELSDILQIKIE